MPASIRERTRKILTFDLMPPWSWSDPYVLIWSSVALGVLFRVVEYLNERWVWLDEGSLLEAIARHSIWEKLANSQAAPIGYVLLVKAIIAVLGDGLLAIRIPSIVSGVASVFLFAWFARRSLAPWTALVAVAMFSFSDCLIYYASEFKQYSGDVAACTAALALGSFLIKGPISASLLAKAFGVGVVLLIFSYPAPFCLAGAGLAGMFQAARRGDKRGFVGLLVMCFGWALLFGPLYLLHRSQIASDTALWQFWRSAFPPDGWNSRSLSVWLANTFLGYFAYPLDFPIWRVDRRIAALPAAVLFIAGFFRAARRDSATLVLVAAPILASLAAAFGRFYPFHGRLVLFLVPCFFYMIARGWELAALSRRTRVLAYAAAFYLIAGSACAAMVGLTGARLRMYGSPFGDHYHVEPFFKLDR